MLQILSMNISMIHKFPSPALTSFVNFRIILPIVPDTWLLHRDFNFNMSQTKLLSHSHSESPLSPARCSSQRNPGHSQHLPLPYPFPPNSLSPSTSHVVFNLHPFLFLLTTVLLHATVTSCLCKERSFLTGPFIDTLVSSSPLSTLQRWYFNIRYVIFLL